MKGSAARIYSLQSAEGSLNNHSWTATSNYQQIMHKHLSLNLRCVCVSVVLAFSSFPSNCTGQGSIVQNGSFDSPSGVGIPGWTCPGYIWVPGYPPGPDGGPFVGVVQYISQTLTTEPGQSYLLQFSIKSLIPGLGQAGPYGIGVSWGTQSPVVYQMTPSYDWMSEQLEVTAVNSQTLLSFTQEYGANPFLDAVSVVAISEPSTLPLFSACAAMLISRIRRK